VESLFEANIDNIGATINIIESVYPIIRNNPRYSTIVPGKIYWSLLYLKRCDSFLIGLASFFKYLLQIDAKICNIKSRASYSIGAEVIMDKTGQPLISFPESLQNDNIKVDFPAPRGPANPILPPGIMFNN